MARGIEGNETSTPKRDIKKPSSSTQSSKGQQTSILGFFQKKSDAKAPVAASTPIPLGKRKTNVSSQLTPAPSSDAVEPPSSSEAAIAERNKENGLPSPVTPAEFESGADVRAEGVDAQDYSSPLRKVIIILLYLCCVFIV
jgi:hypothetical protein